MFDVSLVLLLVNSVDQRRTEVKFTLSQRYKRLGNFFMDTTYEQSIDFFKKTVRRKVIR